MRSFPGLQMHCHNYRHTQPFEGKRVLVVGASFSGQTLVTSCTKHLLVVVCCCGLTVKRNCLPMFRAGDCAPDCRRGAACVPQRAHLGRSDR